MRNFPSFLLSGVRDRQHKFSKRKRKTHLASRSIASCFCCSISAARRLISATCCVVGNPRFLMKPTAKRQSRALWVKVSEQRPTNNLAGPQGHARPHDDWRLAVGAPQSHSLCVYLEVDYLRGELYLHIYYPESVNAK